MSKIIIDWMPDKGSSVPVYKQIIDYMAMKISTGDWAIGGRLPSQRQLAKQFDVNRSTIVTAMEELSSYGVLESDFGKGTYIASNTWSVMMSETPPDWSRYIHSGAFHANDAITQDCNRYGADPSYIRLGSGELSPRLFPREAMRQVLKSAAGHIESLNYGEPLGLLKLRKILSKRLARDGVHVSPSCILITSGAMQALYLISLCMLKPGSTMFTANPSYLKSLQFFHSTGMKLSGIPIDQDGPVYWQIDPGRIQKEEALLYLIPSFHSPTGMVMTQERRQALFRFCRQNRLPIIEDAAYNELWFDEKPPAPIKAMDKNGLVLHIGTVSKSLAPGFRVGWVVGPESVVNRLADMKMQMDYGASSISQIALAEFYASGLYDEYLPSIRSQLKRRRDTALEILERHFSRIASWNIPKGGLYIWLTFHKSLNTDHLFRAALREKILIYPGSIYEYEKSRSIRISYAFADERQLAYGLATLANIAKSIL